MSDSKMREEFEAWVMCDYPGQSLRKYEPLHGVTEGEYKDITLQCCWRAWQASRAKVEIELPKANFFLNKESATWAISECGEAIKAAGLKVKQ